MRPPPLWPGEVCSGSLNDGGSGYEASSELEQIQADLGVGWNSTWVTSTRPPGPNTNVAYTRCRDGLSATHFDYVPTVNSSGQITSGYYTPSKIDYLWATDGFANCAVEQQHADQTNYDVSVQPNCYPGAAQVTCTPDPGEISDHAPLIGATKGAPELQWRLADGSGRIAADSSGSGQPGTLSGSVSWNTSGATAHGGSASFDGSSGQIAASGPVVDTSVSFTVSAWAYVPAGAPTEAALSEGQTNISGFILWYEADAMGGPGSASAAVTGAGTVSVTVPTLIPGHLYGWYAKTDDGSAASATSAVCHFYAAAS